MQIPKPTVDYYLITIAKGVKNGTIDRVRLELDVDSPDCDIKLAYRYKGKDSYERLIDTSKWGFIPR